MRVSSVPIRRAWVAGHTDRLVEVRTSAGLVLRCTPEHRFLTDSDGYVEAQASGRRSAPPGHRRPGHLRSTTQSPRSTRSFSTSLSPSTTSRSTAPTTSASPPTPHDADHAVVVHNSEYMHLDNSACNLASLNLLRFLNDDGSFDVEGFRAAIRVVFTAQEILVGNADYPTERIADTSRRFRQLGLGYANLGALLMALGVAYDSEAGRAWAGAITALMTGEAYATSARTAARMGPFAGYAAEQGADEPGPATCTATSSAVIDTLPRPQPGAGRGPATRGTTPSGWPRSTACATPRPPCSPPPAAWSAAPRAHRAGPRPPAVPRRPRRRAVAGPRHRRRHRRRRPHRDQVLRQRPGAGGHRRHRPRLPHPGHAPAPGQGGRRGQRRLGLEAASPTSAPATWCPSPSTSWSASPSGCRCRRCRRRSGRASTTSTSPAR